MGIGGERTGSKCQQRLKNIAKNCPKETEVCGSYILKGGFIPPLVMIWSSEFFL
jgi:hypothetical protein